MQTRARNVFTSIHTEGAILPVDLLQAILAGDKDLDGLTPDDYHLPAGEKLNEAINRAWNRLQGSWSVFQTGRERLVGGDPGTTIARERWLLPLFQELGYGRLQTTKAITLEGKSYPISHAWGSLPIHLVGCGLDLDKRTPGAVGAARSSPHSMLQEFLNRSDDFLWGMVSNGLQLRVLRDNASLTRQAYLEFDLEAIFEGEAYADFALLWLTCHQSRLEGEQPAEFWLERWSKTALDRGTRALDQLRNGVEEAITALGSGFLAHPANTSLKTRLRSGGLSREDFYRQLLRLVYRLIFLFVAEDRDLLFFPDSTPEERQRYARYYSTTRLRRLAERQRGGRHPDLYTSLRLVTDLLGGRDKSGKGNTGLGLPILGSFLFSNESLPDLETAELDNQSFLNAIRSLSLTVEGNTRRSVDYKNLGPEELGSVYESLLELHPILNADAATFELSTASGHERKTTGSYYTPTSLIQVLLDSALDPVIEQAMDGARRMANGKWANTQEEAYAYSVISGAGNLAKGHGFSGGDLSIDENLSVTGAVRHDFPDSPGGSLHSSEHRGGLGQDRNAGVSTLSANRPGKPSGIGNAPASLSASGALHGGTIRTTAGNDDHFGQANPDSDAKVGIGGDWEKTPFAIRYSQLAERSLLDLKVCDPACGSGHFLIAAAHRIAQKLASVRSGDEAPSPSMTRAALREVISHCIYGVDLNPMAVELCKVNLWLEALEPGKPLSFLDAHIQCGDSLVGVGPRLDISEIPDEAFSPAFGDDKATASGLKKRNKRERGGQLGFRWDVSVLTGAEDLRHWRAERAAQLEAMPEDDPGQVQAKADAFAEFQGAQQYIHNRLELDLWTAAFFWKIPQVDGETMLAPTQQELIQLRNGGDLDIRLMERVKDLAERLNFFHWDLAFPKVFSGDNPGFDCVLGNPPWERIKLQEEEFFAALDPEIAAAPNKAVRQKLIDALIHSNPALAHSFEEARHAADNVSKFMRTSSRYLLTAVGDMNTYPLFAELARCLISGNGRAGIIVPTGIATDDTTKDFFGDLTKKKSIASLFDFENREPIFPGVHRGYKFSLLTLSSKAVEKADFSFFCTHPEHLKDPQRRFYLAASEITLFNPNTLTMPIFRTRFDAELTRKLYKSVPILYKDGCNENSWNVFFTTMFHSSSDAHFFVDADELLSTGFALGSYGEYAQGDEIALPVYEGKMFMQFDHRAATVVQSETALVRKRQSEDTGLADHQNPKFIAHPQYWALRKNVPKKQRWNWVACFKKVTSPTNERTIIATILPPCATNDSIHLIMNASGHSPELIASLLANLNSLVTDFVCRQKLGGVNLNFYVVKQLPILPPSAYTPADIAFIAPRVLELVYTAYDLKPFAEDMGYHGEPFRWDDPPGHRAHLRAELDAYYAKLYGLDHKQLRYILDPADLTPSELEDILDPFEEVDDPLDPTGYAARIEASTFPGETFRVLKEKEIRKYGEYRTRRLVLEAWDKLEGLEPAPVSATAPVVESHPASSEPPAAKPPEQAPPKVKESAPLLENTAQPMLSDFGLYKCGECGTLVMGFEKEKHGEEVHRGGDVEYKKLHG